MKNTNPVGSSWDEFERNHFTSSDIDEHDAKAEIVSELIKARNDGEVTQSQLENYTTSKHSIFNTDTLEAMKRPIVDIQKTSHLFEAFYGKSFQEITQSDVGPAEIIEFGEDVGDEIIE